MTNSLARSLNGANGHPCNCPTPADLIAAGLAGRPLDPTCHAHQADLIAAAEHDRTIAAIVDPANELDAAIEAVRDKFDAEQAQAQEAAATAEREQRLDELTAADQLAGSVARAVGAPMALNASTATFAAALGMTAAE